MESKTLGNPVTNWKAGWLMTKHAKRMMLIAVMALMVPLVSLGVASPALAAPQGAYSVFSQCPTGTSGVTLCTFVQITSGEFVFGGMSVPISKTITLQGGALGLGEGVFAAIPAKNGESLSKTELDVPGGLPGLVDCREIKGRGAFERAERRVCKAIFGGRARGVTATIEGVANESNPVILNIDNVVNGSGTALTLPVRVHLNNPRLGSGCYIGSESSPIELQLTDGTTSPPEPNRPITGKAGTTSAEEEVLVRSGISLVDNTFTVPGAEGCGGSFSSIIDPLIDSTLGLPSNAGYNTAILTGTHKLAAVETVAKSEETIVKSENPEQPGPTHRHHWTGRGPGWGPRAGQ